MKQEQTREKVMLPAMLEDFRNALEAEINTIEDDPNTNISISNGKAMLRIGEENRYVYTMDFISNSIVPDTPCQLQVGKDYYDATIIGIEGTKITIVTSDVLSNAALGKAVLKTSSAALLKKLISRIEAKADLKNALTEKMFNAGRSGYEAKKIASLNVKLNDAINEEQTLEDYREPSGRNEYKDQLLIELYSGMRMGEINALKPEDIDLEKGIVHVKRTVSRGLEYRVFIKEGTKTYTGIRDIPVSSILRPVLEKVLREYEENPNPMGLLFYDEYKNDVIDTNQVNCYFGRVLEKAGVAHRGQHALRHTFATRCIEADVPPLVLKTWLGHRDIHITLDTYADVFENMHNSAIEKVEKYADMIDRSQRHEEE